MIVDQHTSKLPENDEELINTINENPGVIPARLKLLMINAEGDYKIAAGKRLFDVAKKSYTDHFKYFTPESRENSTRNWEFYRMLMFVSYKLGYKDAIEDIQNKLSLKRDEMIDYTIHLSSCTPAVLNIEKIIHAFWWEQIASADPSERLNLANSYEKGENVIKDEERANYWKNYKCQYDLLKLQ
ncbi:MAG: hypothetical protein IBJ00_02590 [Alphaproteobacteria bacterium]|nr:hypothetical protein [Alphaproteobacteria bacterium]